VQEEQAEDAPPRPVRRLPPLVLLLLALLPATASGQEPDCTGPASNPEPGTPAWHQRELENAYCGEQRFRDTSTNPAYAAAKAEMYARNGREVPGDPFRDPPLWQEKRFRYEQVSIPSPTGHQLAGYLFRPLAGKKPPYPGVVIVHGGAAYQEMYWWAAQGLAEAGYMVLTFQIPVPDNSQSEFHHPDAKAALDWLMSPANPRFRELDRRRVGLAGHSAGGVAVSRLGQEDPRVSAIVSWDRAQSSPMPEDLPLRTPALFLVADYLCQRSPVCVPQPFTSPPDPLGPGNKDEDFRRLAAAGVDSMKVTMRASTHLDFTQFSPAVGSRYGAAVSFYYTRAWFDRYLRKVPAARLVATSFDDSADVHNISGGTYDAEAGKNVPAFIAGQPAADRLSFEFRSAYFLDRGRQRCDDMRAGC
jgi:dienelactone hydrolase